MTSKKKPPRKRGRALIVSCDVSVPTLSEIKAADDLLRKLLDEMFLRRNTDKPEPS